MRVSLSLLLLLLLLLIGRRSGRCRRRRRLGRRVLIGREVLLSIARRMHRDGRRVVTVCGWLGRGRCPLCLLLVEQLDGSDVLVKLDGASVVERQTELSHCIHVAARKLRA